MLYQKDLQLTDKSLISKEGEECITDENYNPDKEIMKLISKQINCTLPWIEIKFEGMKECKSENDFDNYLRMISKRQRDIKQVPPKCKFKTWTPIPYNKGSTADESTSVDFWLTILASKVIFYEKGENSLKYGIQILDFSLQAVNMEEEEYKYSLEYFIGIFGGYLGLFLGGSILGIVEFFDGIFSRIINHSSN